MAEVVLRGEPLEIVTTEPALSPSPLAERGTDECDGRPGVEPEGLEKLLFADGVEGQRVRGAADGAHEQVDPTEGLDRPIGEEPDGCFAVHRPRDADDIESLGAERGFGRRHPPLIAAVDHHCGTLAGQAEGTRPADARISGRAGDNGDPPREPFGCTAGSPAPIGDVGSSGPMSGILSQDASLRHVLQPRFRAKRSSGRRRPLPLPAAWLNALDIRVQRGNRDLTIHPLDVGTRRHAVEISDGKTPESNGR